MMRADSIAKSPQRSIPYSPLSVNRSITTVVITLVVTIERIKRVSGALQNKKGSQKDHIWDHIWRGVRGRKDINLMGEWVNGMGS